MGTIETSVQIQFGARGRGTIGPGSTPTTITPDQPALLAGQSMVVTFEFEEAITDLTSADMVAYGGTITEPVTFDDGFTWTTTFTATEDIYDTTGVVTLIDRLPDESFADNEPPFELETSDGSNTPVQVNPVIDQNTLYKAWGVAPWNDPSTFDGFTPLQMRVPGRKEIKLFCSAADAASVQIHVDGGVTKFEQREVIQERYITNQREINMSVGYVPPARFGIREITKNTENVQVSTAISKGRRTETKIETITWSGDDYTKRRLQYFYDSPAITIVQERGFRNLVGDALSTPTYNQATGEFTAEPGTVGSMVVSYEAGYSLFEIIYDTGQSVASAALFSAMQRAWMGGMSRVWKSGNIHDANPPPVQVIASTGRRASTGTFQREYSPEGVPEPPVGEPNWPPDEPPEEEPPPDDPSDPNDPGYDPDHPEWDPNHPDYDPFDPTNPYSPYYNPYLDPNHPLYDPNYPDYNPNNPNDPNNPQNPDNPNYDPNRYPFPTPDPFFYPPSQYPWLYPGFEPNSKVPEHGHSQDWVETSRTNTTKRFYPDPNDVETFVDIEHTIGLVCKDEKGNIFNLRLLK